MTIKKKNPLEGEENEHRRKMSEAGEPMSIGEGSFGHIYDWAGRDQREAFDFLIGNESGDLFNVFYRDDIGGIDLVWGDRSRGLAHIINKHVGYNEDGVMRDFATIDDAAKRIVKVLNEGRLVHDSSRTYVVSDDGFKVAIRKDFDGEKKNWVVTAVDYNRSKKEKGIATNPTPASHSAKGAELDASRNTRGKGNNNFGNSKENGENLRFREEDDDEGTAERAERREIIERAQRDGTLGKAPNGKPSRLVAIGGNELWARVRTPQFKSWFGDWEKPARIEKLRKSKIVSITGEEITPSDNLKQYKKNAIEYGKKLQGEYENDDTHRLIQLQRGRKNGGLNEVLQHDLSPVQIQSIAAIPQIIKNSIYIESADNHKKDKNPDIVKYHYYVCGLKIGGKDYTVRMVEAEQSDGRRYYDHKLTKIKLGNLLDEIAQSNLSSPTELSSTSNSGVANRYRPTDGGEIQRTPISEYKDKTLLSILQTNCSKILDENGEPLVVYHGTLGGEDL